MSVDLKSDSLERSLPSEWYTSAKVFCLEQEHIYSKEWMCAGREECLPSVGDHKVLEVAGESVIIVRNESETLRAFYNVCRHRGAQLCSTEPNLHGIKLKGGVINGKLIACPYHAWSYNLDGNLINTPHLNTTEGFTHENHALYPVGCEVWGGFFFLNLTPKQAPDFDASISMFAERYRRYPLEKLITGKVITYTVDANWKVLCENYNECYHCGPVHPELCELVPAFRDKGGADLDWEHGVVHRPGADTFSFSGKSKLTVFEGLNEEELDRHKGDLIYPNLFLSFAKDHVASFTLRPVSVNKTEVVCEFLFHPGEINQPEAHFADVVEFWDLVNKQDWAICSSVQRGISSRVHEHGCFSPMEDYNLDIRRYVEDRIAPYINR